MEQKVAVNLNTDTSINVNLPEEVSCGTFEVSWGEGAEIQVETVLTYIKSGEQEIDNYVKGTILPPLQKYVDQAKEAASNADADAENAKESAGLAYESEQKAKQSEEKAFQEANASAESAYQSQQSALAAYEYASNADEDAKNALETLGHVLESENKARIWADGNDEEVLPLGGTHSSMVSAGLSYAYANAPEDTPVEEWATTHDLIVQGEKGDKGETGEKGQPFKYEDFTQEQLDSLMFFEAGSNLEFVQGENKKILNAIVPDITGLATKDYVDTTEQEIIKNFMDSDTALQTQITGLSGVLNTAQDNIVTINTKIPTSASSSNLLVTMSDLQNSGQEIRSDFMDSDSELQQQINAHALELNRLDDVKANKTDIPDKTTLATKDDLQDVRADFMQSDSELQQQINGQASAIATLEDDVMSNMSEIADVKSSVNGKKDAEKYYTLTETAIDLEANTIYRAEELSSVEIHLPSVLTQDFICEIAFSSGAVATQFITIDDIKWTGDDIADDAFVPIANKRYNVIIWWDGVFVNGVVRGV